MPVRARSRFFHLGDDLLARAADRPQLVELGIDAVAREAAVARERRRVVDERRLDPLPRTSARSSSSASSERTSGACSSASTVRTRGIAASDCFRPTRSRGPAVPSAARATSRSRSCTALIASRNLPRSVVRNASSSTASSRSRIGSSDDQRPQQPRAQQPAADRRDGAIELVEQRSVAAALRPFDDLQVLQRRRIDEQRVGALAVGDRADVREIDLLRRRAGSGRARRRRDRRRPAVEAEAFEPAGAQLIEQRAARRFEVERPGVDRRDRQRPAAAIAARGAGSRRRRRRARRSRAA